jgi:Photosynthetic reaction centre cytochrome C subunit
MRYVTTLAVLASCLILYRLDASPQTVPSSEKKVGRNLQILQVSSQAELLRNMHVIRASLGVHCDYCHEVQNEQYSSDSKPAKKKAREMIRMVMALNTTYFDGKPRVGCNTCHRGSTVPSAGPDIAQANFADTTKSLPARAGKEDFGFVPLRIPIPDRLTRVSKGTAFLPEVATAGSGEKLAVPRAKPIPITVFQEYPNRYTAVLETPSGHVCQIFDGTRGWLKAGVDVRALTPEEMRRVEVLSQIDSGRLLPDHPAVAPELLAPEKLLAYRDSASGTSLVFSMDTGLLRRVELSTFTQVGRDVQQIEFTRWLSLNGHFVPVEIDFSFLDDNHFGNSRKFTQVQEGVSLPPKVFSQEFSCSIN